MRYPFPYYVIRAEYQRYQQAIEAVRAALGDEAFDTAFAADKALPLEQTIAEALAMPIPGAASDSPGCRG